MHISVTSFWRSVWWQVFGSMNGNATTKIWHWWCVGFVNGSVRSHQVTRISSRGKRKLFIWELSWMDLSLVVHQPEWKRAAVSASVMHSFWKSSGKHVAELGNKRSTMQLRMKMDLGLQVLLPSAINELMDYDLKRRQEACKILLKAFPTLPACKYIHFFDKCVVYRSSWDTNIFIWAKDNLHFFQEI